MIEKLIDLVNSKIGCGYVFGGQNDKPLTKEALASLVKIFGRSHYYFSNYSAERWLGKEYYDCSGLIVYALQKMGLIPVNADYTADSMFNLLCIPINKAELKAGDLCFNKTSSGIVHVGVYMGDNRVTHARGTFYGVVNTALFESFNSFGRLKYFKDELEKPADELKEALLFLSTKSGINKEVWYKTAKVVKYLDKCFIMIANAFKKEG